MYDNYQKMDSKRLQAIDWKPTEGILVEGSSLTGFADNANN